jgi:hypothetical protein
MDFTYPAEAEAFRKDFRAWLDENLTDDLPRWRSIPSATIRTESSDCGRGTARSRTPATRRSPGLPHTAGEVRRSWSRSCTRRRCIAPEHRER